MAQSQSRSRNAILALSCAELIEQYRHKSLSPVEVMQATLDAAHVCNNHFNAFGYLAEDEALAAAQASEERWMSGTPKGLLDGVPIPVKDLTDVAGWPTYHGSRSTDTGHRASGDASCVARLREAGAVFFAKSHTPEFGWKGITDSPLAGITRNPWNAELTSGGSSGGAGVSVAAGVTAMAHGNDGGGSVRIPASYCGVFGIKPTFGRVADFPRTGAYDTHASEGVLSRTVFDAALFLNEVTKPDLRDWYALPADGTNYLDFLERGVKGLRVAVSLSLGGVSPSADIGDAVKRAAQSLEESGAHVEEVGDVFEPLQPQFNRYWLGGLFRRVDSVARDRRALLDPDLLRVAADGEDVTLAEFSAGMQARGRLAGAMHDFHQRYDVLLTPTMPTDPPPVGTPYHTPDFDRWRHATPYTVGFNLTGQPAASIPCGLSDAGCPVGLQIVGAKFADATVMQVAAEFERSHPVTLPDEKV